MAFGDLLKKVADKGVEFVNSAVEVGKQMIEEQKIQMTQDEENQKVEQVRRVEKTQAEKDKEEVERKEAARLRREQEEARRKKELEKILKPTCEKGDCLWYGKKFYFTCEEGCECERKEYTKKDWGGACAAPEFWPYMKRVEKIEKDYPKAISSDKERLMKKVYIDFMNEFLPQYPVADWAIARCFVDSALVESYGMHPILLMLQNTKKEPQQIIEKLNMVRYYLILNEKNAKDPFWSNLSLYQRSMDDFEYTIKLFTTVLDENKLRGYFKDISGISVDQLYDADGKIKKAGLGGPQAGFYGDVLYNIVESWGGEDGENNASYSEE